MNKRVTHILAAAAMWSFCMLLIVGVLPRFGLQLLGELGRPLSDWLPLLLGIFLITAGALAVRLRMQSRGGYRESGDGDELLVAGRRRGEDRVPLLRVNGLPGDGAGIAPGRVPEPLNVNAESLPEGEGRDQVERPRPRRTTVQLSAGRLPGKGPRPVEEVGQTTPDGGESRRSAAEASPVGGPDGEAEGGQLHRRLQLPVLTGDFFGRSVELAELESARIMSHLRILGLQGVGGIGKTSLAVAFARQVATDYPDALLHLDLRGQGDRPLSVAEAQGQVIRAYRPFARLPEHEQDLQRLYQSVLGEMRGILLLDNVTSSQQLQSLLPPTGGGAGGSGEQAGLSRWLTIFTTRQPLSVPGQALVHVEPLPSNDARRLLQSLAPRVGTAGDRIIGGCGQVPLALRLIGTLIQRHPEISVETLPARLASRQSGPLPGGPVENALRLCLDLLSENHQKQWRALAVFPGSFDLTAAAAVWKLHPDLAAEGLERLTQNALVEHDPATDRYRLHDVVLTFLESRLVGEEQREARHRFAAHYQSLLHEAEALYEEAGPRFQAGIELLDREWHNILAGQVWATSLASQDRSACELCSAFPDAGKHLLQLRLNPRERIRWIEAALEAARVLNRRKSVIRHLIALGDAYSDLCETQHAIDIYQQSLDLALASQDRRGEALARIGLGNAFSLVGSLDRAREFHDQSLELANQLKDPRLEMAALGNLAASHAARGEVQTAQLLFDQQFKLARRVGDRRQEALGLGGIGMTDLAMGKIDLATEFLERQLLLAKEIGDRHAQAMALTYLGKARGERQDYRRGLDALEEALAICLELADRRGESVVLGGLGAAHFQRREIEIARQFFDRQLALSREIGDRLGEGKALLSLSEIALETDNRVLAADLARQALVITSSHGDVLGQGTAHYRLALAHAAAGDLRKAASSADRASQLLQEIQLPILGEVEGKLAEWSR